MIDPDSGPIPRRRLLAAAGVTAGVGIAGCSGVIESDDSTNGDGPTQIDEGGAGVIERWNEELVLAIQEFRGGNFAPSRRNAMLNVAAFDAVNAITAARGHAHYEPYLDDLGEAPEDASRPAAAAAAAHEVLSGLYAPDFQNALEESLDQARELGGDVEAGTEWGRTVASRVFDLRENDADYDFGRYEACPDDPHAPGCFRESWVPARAYVDPWTMTDRAQFRPGGPPPLDSEAYAEGWQETYEYGEDTGDRPQEHVDIAGFWRGSSGSPRLPGMWNTVGQTVAEQEDFRILENARLFALLGLALADAGIAASAGKEHFGFWRPARAIRYAAEDGNPETEPDPDWTPLSVGGSPEYPSGLATFGGAGAGILRAVVGTDDYSFEFGSGINTGLDGETPGVSRSFDSFTEARDESMDSRIYVGNHYRFSVEDGANMGEQIATWVLDNHLQPVE